MRPLALARYCELLESMPRLDIRLLCYNFMAGPGYSTLGRLFANGYLKAPLKGTEK